MMAGGSLRFRLLAGGAAWIAAALTGAGLLISGLFADHVARRLDAELNGHLNQLAAALETAADGETVIKNPLSDPRFQRPLSGLYWQVEPPKRAILRSRSLWDAELALPRDELGEGMLHRHRLPGPGGAELIVLERAVLPADGERRVRLAVAVDAGELTAAVDAFNRPLAWSLLALWAGLTAAATAQVQVGLRPLARLRADLADVRAGRTRRLPAAAPREVAPVVAELNAVLDHDEAVVARARLEAGNLAHALKTDLAVLRNDAARLAGAAGTAAREAAEIPRLVDRMTRQIDRHMARARAAASVGVPGARTPAAPAVERLFRVMARLHSERGLTLAHMVSSTLEFHGDGEDLTEMLGNLLDNACKWAKSRVDLTAVAQADGVFVLTICDDGPGLSPEERILAVKAGVRLDETAPGSGLGLAVAADLATLYGGGLTLEESPLGGLAAVLRLPGA
jgi:signal transduction histidine kinase